MTLITLKDAVVVLEKAGILGKETKQKEQAVKYLLKQGLIEGVQPPANQPKIGWKVNLDSLNEYIQIGNMKKNEMVKELIELRRKVRELEFHQVQTTDDVPLQEAIHSVIEQEKQLEQAETEEETEVEGKEETASLVAEVTEIPEIKTATKVEITKQDGAKTYFITFHLNKQPYEGKVSTSADVQFEEIWNENSKFVYGKTEEESVFLDNLASKLRTNIARKILAFDKKSAHENN